jgi:uncharacterized membrane protein
MTAFLIAVSYVIHTLATVIFIGHYLLHSLIYLPALSHLEGAGPAALGAISQRSRYWLYSALVFFAITGVYLMIIDPNYLGLGNFNNPWAILMLVKHLVILVMIGLGFWYNFIVRVGPMMRSNTSATQGVISYRTYCSAMTICGILVLILTSLAQVE